MYYNYYGNYYFLFNGLNYSHLLAVSTAEHFTPSVSWTDRPAMTFNWSRFGQEYALGAVDNAPTLHKRHPVIFNIHQRMIAEETTSLTCVRGTLWCDALPAKHQPDSLESVGDQKKARHLKREVHLLESKGSHLKITTNAASCHTEQTNV